MKGRKSMQYSFNRLRQFGVAAVALMVCFGAANADYLVDFEAAPAKGAYASGDVVLNGIAWNMAEALIGGGEPADWKNGLKSARMRGYGASSMTMLEDKTGGVGTVSFYYRCYGTDAQVDWKVEYSTDEGDTWTQVGEDFTAPVSETEQLFSEEINVVGNVRIRIKRATESGKDNRRLCIDDILLTDYEPSDWLPTPTGLVSRDVGADGFSAFWDAVTGAEAYKISIYTIEFSGSWPDLDETLVPVTGWQDVVTTSASKVVTGLSPKTTYYWKVVAANDEIESDPSVFAEITTLDAGGGAPAEAPAITAIALLPAGGAEVTCLSQTGADYLLQWTDSLVQPIDWQTIESSSRAGTGGNLTLTDSSDRGAACFYRVVVRP